MSPLIWILSHDFHTYLLFEFLMSIIICCCHFVRSNFRFPVVFIAMWCLLLSILIISATIWFVYQTPIFRNMKITRKQLSYDSENNHSWISTLVYTNASSHFFLQSLSTSKHFIYIPHKILPKIKRKFFHRTFVPATIISFVCYL